MRGCFKKGHTINSGRVLTAEHKEKIRTTLLNSAKEGKAIGRPKGGTPWNKGMRRANGDPIPPVTPMSEEARKRISAAISERMKGRRVSTSTEFKKGMTPHNKGKRLSEITRRKIGEANKGREAWNKGIPASDAVRDKIRKAKKGKQNKPEAIVKMLTRRTPSSLEEKFQEIIDKHNLPYKFVGNGSFMIGRKNPDFINVNGEKIAIEVYAKYYKLRHYQTIEEWKEERRKVFKEYGWEVLFFDAMQVNESNILRELRR